MTDTNNRYEAGVDSAGVLPEGATLVQTADWLIEGGIFDVVATSNLARDGDTGTMTVPANLVLALACFAQVRLLQERLRRAGLGKDMPQSLSNAADNVLIAYGMGWDMEGVIENLREAIARATLHTPEPSHD